MEQVQYVTEAEHLIRCSLLLIKWLELTAGLRSYCCVVSTGRSASSSLQAHSVLHLATSGDF